MLLIYHITHVDNLAGIVSDGCLFSDLERIRKGLNSTNIGYGHIKDRRLNTAVPVSAGGCLGDYVPFYFAPNSPMLYTIHRGNVPGYEQGQKEIVYLLVDAEPIMKQSRLPWAFTDRHAVVAFAEFFDDVSELNKVDWDLMKAQYWTNTEHDPDRKERRQAEFLIHKIVPWELVFGIGVYDDEMLEKVKAAIRTAAHQPQIKVKRDWYF